MHLCWPSTWLCFLLIITFFQHNQASSKVISRHFYYHLEGTTCFEEYNITLPSSTYLTQRLISEVVKQLLRDKLGYQSLEFASENSTHHSDCSNHCTTPEVTSAPPSYYYDEVQTVNAFSNESCITPELPPPVLVDMRPSTEAVQTDYTDMGYLGLSTRHGLYMSSSVVSQLRLDGMLIANSYSGLVDSAVVSKFTAYDQQIKEAVLNQRRATPNQCSDVSCFKFAYSPQICESQSCVTLLVGNMDMPTSQLEELIDRLGLRVQVIYLEEQLSSVVLSLSSSDIPLLFFTRAPDVLTIDPSFTRVRSLNGSCELPDSDCNFHVVEIRKLLWNYLIQPEPLIYQLIKNIHFDDNTILNILNAYRKVLEQSTPPSVEEFITSWLLANADVIEKWIPSGTSEKPQLIIGGYFPLSQSGAWRDVKVSIAADLAIELVNEDSTVLGDHNLALLVNDSHCDSSFVLKTFTEYLTDDQVWPNMVGGLGPACDDTAIEIAGLALHYRYVMISYSVGAIVLSLDRERYKYFYRTVPQMDEYAQVYVDLFKELNLQNSKVSMLTDESSGELPVYHRKMSQVFSEEGITLAIQEILPKMQYLQEEGTTENAYGKYLDRIKAAHSYIIIMDVFEEAARHIMCAAYSKQMTMKYGYIWFLPDHYRWDWYKPDGSVDCNFEEMTEALTGYVSLAHSNLDKSNNVAVGGMNGTEFERVYKEKVWDELGSRHTSVYGSYAYDAVWTFAKALDSLYKENPAYLKYIHDPHVAEEYITKIKETDFRGVSGEISFNELGHRSGTIMINRYNNTSAVDSYLSPTVIGSWSKQERLKLTEGIQWGVKLIPETTSPLPADCEWERLRTALQMESCLGSLLVVVIPLLVLIILAIVLCAFGLLVSAKRKYRMAAELASKYGEGQAFGAFLNFDEKEISRDHVVLNRKLGEGAFGTVYGGEAYISSLWTGVAVKTLKVGSNSEDKLDFLREADIMKRFDHKNIVKLLGVTTRGEPAYAIMEFMLYGDLKTYLLSRRELVGMGTKEVEDISAASLTRMALDVIEGLSYLHSKEYIHRDIACRNCLVSSNRTVKIGDFGMTRRVYDDGSYVFTRRGRLPVRWMAPESFVDGVFTYKTDMWSYGVLLYEIITFGSVPYHMLTNAEVFEGVKSGKTLTLPEECTDELKTLMLGCWTTDSSHRPNPYDVYITLKNNENMIQPLLSCPALAKIRECDSVELDLSPTFLKSSTLLKKPFLRQSSSVISVDTGMAFSRHRNHSEISYRRSASHRRRSSHSIIDLFSLVNPHHGPPPTPLSLPSPSHSNDTPVTFHFPTDNRQVCPEPTCCESKMTTHCRAHHNSGSASTTIQPPIAENDYLLTTRSCTDIDDHSHHSHAPLIQNGETAI